MSQKVTVLSLFEKHQNTLQLDWVTSPLAVEQTTQLDLKNHQYALVGFLNIIHPNYIQVLGNSEIAYLDALGSNSYNDCVESLLAWQPFLIIFTDKQQVNNEFIARANSAHIPIISTPQPAERVIDHLQYSLSNQLAEKQIHHGVFMEIMGLGVLLTGPSGVGKSELALELLSRGHRLIADDAPEFYRSMPDTIHGSCPALLADFLEVRGIGIINIRAMYGNHAILAKKRLHLIIELQPLNEATTINRLDTEQHYCRILEVDIPEMKLPVAPGRDLAVIIEVAVRNHILVLNGYNATEDFVERQRQQINNQSHET